MKVKFSTALGVPAATEIKAHCTYMPFKYWSCSEEASSYRFSLNRQWPLPRSSQDHSDQNNAHTQTLSAKITRLWYNYSSRGVTSNSLVSLMSRPHTGWDSLFQLGDNSVADICKGSLGWRCSRMAQIHSASPWCCHQIWGTSPCLPFLLRIILCALLCLGTCLFPWRRKCPDIVYTPNLRVDSHVTLLAIKCAFLLLKLGRWSDLSLA